MIPSLSILLCWNDTRPLAQARASTPGEPQPNPASLHHSQPHLLHLDLHHHTSIAKGLPSASPPNHRLCHPSTQTPTARPSFAIHQPASLLHIWSCCFRSFCRTHFNSFPCAKEPRPLLMYPFQPPFPPSNQFLNPEILSALPKICGHTPPAQVCSLGRV